MADIEASKMRLKISHTTVYTYDRPVRYALQQLRLTPRSADGQEVLKWTSHVTGGTRQLGFVDQYRNPVDLILMEESDRLEIVSEGEVEVEDRSGVVGPGRSLAPQWLFQRRTAATAPGPLIRKLARGIEKSLETDQLAAMHELMAAVAQAVVYETGSTVVTTTAEEAMGKGHGVCQDQAHTMISAARVLGLAARYVSGYLLMEGTETQSAGHGWCEVWIAGLGWVGFDAANDMCPDDRYVRVALGRDYADAAPVHGLRQGDAREELCVSVQVQQ